MTKVRNNLYTIKDVSGITGVHPQTLRNWEKDGLIEPIRVAGNQRIYTEQHIERIEQILDLKEEGLQLKGIRNVLNGNVKGITATKAKATTSRRRKKADEPLMTVAQTLEKPKPKAARKTRKTNNRRTNASSKYDVNELNELNLKQLTEIARQEGVKYFRQMFKEELITAIAYPERREEMKEQAKARTKERYGHKVYGERARAKQQNRRVQYAQRQQTPKSSKVVNEKDVRKAGLAEANNEEMDTQQLLIKQILDLGEEGKSPEEIAKALAEAYK